MKKIYISLFILLFVFLLRDNFAFFLGNIFGVFKLDNNYYDGIIKLKDEKIDYLEKEINNINDFSSKLDKISYNYKVSKITYKETYNTNKYIIQYGNNDNIIKGLAVTNEYGLIGKVTKVNKNTSELTTLRDLKDVSVVVNTSYGKLNYDYEKDIFVISDISNYDTVHVNDVVYTSGYGIIKEKLYIGKVTSIELKDFKKEIFVKSSVDFNNLNYVLIVGDFK